MSQPPPNPVSELCTEPNTSRLVLILCHSVSVHRSRVTYMAGSLRNGNQVGETFHKFFECWIVEQNHHLQQLVSALKQQEQVQNQNGQTELVDKMLRPLVERVIQHYQYYYRAKSGWAKNDVISTLNPSWRSSLENAFLWVGGWRPSMAFHLLYSKSGMQFHTRLEGIIQGLSTGDLGDLSPSQLNQVNKLHMETVKEITEKLAKQQVADSSMVALSHAATELIREVKGSLDDGRIKETLAPKEEQLVDILQEADDLRMKTLEKILKVMTPAQGVHFLIAAAELHSRLHEWGKIQDTRNQ